MTPQPQQPNWADFSRSLPQDMPDTAYDALRDKFFNENVAPSVLKQGYGIDTAHKQFMKQTERPGKSAMPRTELVAKEAAAAFAAPLGAIDKGAAQDVQATANRAAREAQRQGINPAPYQFAGGMIGQLPYWAAGMGAVEEGAAALKAGPLLTKAIKTAAGGVIQGSYDLAKTQNVIEGLKGAATGAAIVGGFESIGPLAKYLMKSGVSSDAASSVEAVAKGLATDSQWQSAIDTSLSHGRLDDDISAWVGEQVHAAKMAGVPKEISTSPSFKGLQVSMTGADGKPYSFSSPAQIDKLIDRMNDHLMNGGSIDSIGGDPKQVSRFFQMLSNNQPTHFDLDLPLKDVTGKATPPGDDGSPVAMPQVNDEAVQLPPTKKQPVPNAPAPLEVLENLRATLGSDRGATMIDPSVNIMDPQVQKILQAGQQKGFLLRTGEDGTRVFGDPKLTQRLLDANKIKMSVDVNRLINARNSYFHATDLEGFRGVLEEGAIKPGKLSKGFADDPLPDEPDHGVSVSRSPRVASKADKAITFVIDRDKMPATRPYVEEGYGKTTEPGFGGGELSLENILGKEMMEKAYPGEYTPKEAERNPHFEFEQRTYNEPIPLSAVRGIVVDKSALLGSGYETGFAGSGLEDDLTESLGLRESSASKIGEFFNKGEYAEAAKRLAKSQGWSVDEAAEYLETFKSQINLNVPTLVNEVQQLAKKANIPVKIMESGREVHSYRAGLAKQPEDMRWSIPLYDQLQTLSDGSIHNKLNGQIYDNIADAVADTPHDEKAASTELVRGSADMPLDQRGLAHADHLGERLALKGGLDKLVTSDLTRTRQTAHGILNADPKTQLVDVTPNLQSWASGELEGAPHTEEISDYKNSLAKNFPDHEIGGMGQGSTRPGESFNQMKNRVLPYVQRLVDEFNQNPEQKIGAVTHFSPIRLIDAWVKKGMPGDYDVDTSTFTRQHSQPAGVYRLAPNDEGTWKLRKINIDNDQQLQPGIYFIRHGETGWNKGGALAQSVGESMNKMPEMAYKETPLAHRFSGNIPDDVLPEGAKGVTIPAGEGQKPSIFYRETNKELIFHENLHGHYSYLGLDDFIQREHGADPIVHQIFNGAFPEDAQRLYQQGGALAEEVFTYAASAVRTGNEKLLDSFADANTSKDHVLNWVTDTANDLRQAAAEAPDSLHKRTLERRLGSVVSRATGKLEDVERLRAGSPYELDVDRGRYAVREGNSTDFFNSRQDAVDFMEQNYQEPLQAPELVPTQSIPDGTPRYALKVPAPTNEPPKTTDPTLSDLTPKPIKAGTSTFSFFFRPFYDWLGDVAHKFDRPDLFSAFSRVDDKIIEYNNAMRPYVKTLMATIAKHSERQTDFLKWIQADVEHRPFIEQELKFKPEELKALKDYDTDFLENFPELRTFLQQDMEKLRNANWEAKTVYPQGKSMGQAAGLVTNGRIDPRDSNLVRLSSVWMRSDLHSSIVEPALEDAETLTNEKIGGKDALGQLAPLLRRHIAYTRGVPDVTANAIQGALEATVDSINQGIEKVNSKLPSGMQIPTIGDAPQDLLQKYIMFSYAGALAARPGVLARASLQTFITGFPLMGNYIWKGMARTFEVAKAGTESNAWKVAEKYGVFIEKAGLQEMLAGGSEMGFEEQLADKALRMIQWSHNSSRLVSFWGHTEKALDALRGSHDPEDFSKAADLWFMPEGMRNKYLKELQHADPKNYEDLSRRIGADLTGLTQWNYRKGANPGLYKWQLGRLFGQYGTWPLNYIEYARRYAGGSDKTAAVQALTRLTVAHGAVLAAGMSAGIDTHDWVFAQPMAWGGGPLLQATVGLPTAIGDWHSAEGSEARQNLLDLINPIDLMPGAEEAQQVLHAVSSHDPDLWIRLLGFKPLKD